MDESSSPNSPPKTYTISDPEAALYSVYIQAERADVEREKRKMQRQIDDLSQKLEISKRQLKEATRIAKNMEWYKEQINALRLGSDQVSSHYGAAIAQLQFVQANYNGLHQYYEHLRQHANQLTGGWYVFQTTVEDSVNTPRQGGAAQQLLALKKLLHRKTVRCSKTANHLPFLTHPKTRERFTQVPPFMKVQQHNAAEPEVSSFPARWRQELQQLSALLNPEALHFAPSWSANNKNEGLAPVNNSSPDAVPSVFHAVKHSLILCIRTSPILILYSLPHENLQL